MDLILWRHADAGDALADAQADLLRPLTPRGEKQARRMAEWLNRFLPERTRLLASPARRCQQTAQALGRRFRSSEALAPAAGVAQLLAAARWPDHREPVLVVGHQPTLGRTAAYLMGCGTLAAQPAWDAGGAGAPGAASEELRDEAGRLILPAAPGSSARSAARSADLSAALSGTAAPHPALLAAVPHAADGEPGTGRPAAAGADLAEVLGGDDALDDGAQAPGWSVRKGAVWWLRRRERNGRAEVVLVAVRTPELL